MALKIEARHWVAAWYRCPICGTTSGELQMTPYRWKHRHPRQCFGYKCKTAVLEVVEHRWYTTFCIEPSLSRTTIAGTLKEIGPFEVCHIVHPNLRAFRRWYKRRRTEEDEKARQYFERERQIDAEYRARLARQRQEAALLKEAERVAYRREHAGELAAERVARAVWPVESQLSRQSNPAPALSDDDFDPFLDADE